MPDPHSLATSAHDIDVWLTYYHAIVDPQLLANLHALLDDAERARQQHFFFDEDRLRYLVTRAMVRSVLSRYAAVDPAAWTFSENPWGRPEIAARHNLPGLHFNLSHTHGLIALAVSTHGALGVDVENVAVREPSFGIANRYFSPAEVAALAALPQAQRKDRFFEYWTLKESYIKARGMGLSLPLDRFSFHFPAAHEVRLAIDDDLGDDAAAWQFWQCRPRPDYLLALCAQRRQGTVTVRTIVPTLADAEVETAWFRTSVHPFIRC
jgi:4'-phosphopantetheinyl transferase